MKFKGEDVVIVCSLDGDDEYFSVGAVGTVVQIKTGYYGILFEKGKYKGAPDKRTWFVTDSELEPCTKLAKLLYGIENET